MEGDILTALGAHMCMSSCTRHSNWQELDSCLQASTYLMSGSELHTWQSKQLEAAVPLLEDSRQSGRQRKTTVQKYDTRME